jgi:hypothetical protein
MKTTKKNSEMFLYIGAFVFTTASLSVVVLLFLLASIGLGK